MSFRVNDCIRVFAFGRNDKIGINQGIPNIIKDSYQLDIVCSGIVYSVVTIIRGVLLWFV